MNSPLDKKAMKFIFIEICFALGFIMGAVVWPMTLFLWKSGALNLQASWVSVGIIWGFQMGFAGAMYMVFAPVAHYMCNNTLRSYHFPVVFIGLCIVTFTGSNLARSGMLPSTFWFLLVPPFMAFVMMAIKNNVDRSNQKIATPE